MYSTRPPGVRQEPFDAIPLNVQRRHDLTGNPKRLYAALQSAQRMKWQPTYADLAERLSASVRSIIRWMARLVAAGLIAVRRRGQGQSNIITVLALGVRSDKLSQPTVPAWQPAPPSPFNKRTGPKKPEYPRVNTDPAAFTSGEHGWAVHT
jgi:hypothetical protein